MDIYEFLKAISPFSDLKDDDLRIIASNALVVEHMESQTIKRRGTIGRFIWVVYDGSADIVATHPDKTREVIATLNKGEIMGEMSIMTGEPGGSDIIAKRDCKLIMIPREIFSPIIIRNPHALLKITNIITKRIVQKEHDRLHGVPGRLEAPISELDDPYDLLFSSSQIPIKILIVNCGSSSLKFCLFDTSVSSSRLEGLIENIGKDTCRLIIRTDGEKTSTLVNVRDINDGLKIMVETIIDPSLKLLKDINELQAVGHRVVHGGERFSAAVVINDEVIEAIRECSIIAPLHNPYNLAGIELMQELAKKAVHVAVFDTAFHQTIPSTAFKYALPEEMYTKEKIRRYGFHGTNHEFVALKAAMHLKRPLGELNLISCHLGNGSSLCAIQHGRSIDTTMGMTPLEGLIMGTRSGDIDPGVPLYLLRKEGYNVDRIDKLLNRESGLLGLSGVSSDMREVIAAAESGNSKATDAITMFCYRIKKYIGSYIVALGNIDAIIFTAGIGENSVEIRARICQGLEQFGIVLFHERNRNLSVRRGEVKEISEPGTKIKVLVIPAEEERMIARETLHAINRFKTSEEIVGLRTTPIPISVSAHHAHVTEEDFHILFGPDAILTPRTQLSQPGQFASEQTINLIGPKGKVDRVRILGPFRDKSQVEISKTEEFKLGIDAPVRNSGDITGTPGLKIEGTYGSVILKEGVICAKRHIHMSPQDALGFGLRDRDTVMVKVKTDRGIIFGDVLVRVHPQFRLDMHIDTDEANAAEIVPGTSGYIESIQSRVYM